MKNVWTSKDILIFILFIEMFRGERLCHRSLGCAMFVLIKLQSSRLISSKKNRELGNPGIKRLNNSSKPFQPKVATK